MSLSLEELQSTLASVQEELQRVRRRLDELEKVVSIDTDDDGIRRVYLECNDLVVRPAHDPRWISVNLGASEDGGYLHLHHRDEATVAAELSLDSEGEPQFMLRGRDHEPRVSLYNHEGCGLVAVHAAEGRPGALMRAQQRGGSIAVLQKDGSSRAVLVHDDGRPADEDGNEIATATDLIFANEDLHTTMKLHTDSDGPIISLGPPGQPDALALIVREGGPGIMLHSPGEQTGICLMALDSSAQISAHESRIPGEGYEAKLTSGSLGSGISLHGINGEKAADLSALEMASSLTLHDRNGETRVMMAHHFGSHSALTLQSNGDEDGFRAVASGDVSSLELMSPTDPDTKMLHAVTSEKPLVILQKEKRPLLMFGEGDQGGVFCAYGNVTGQAGIATLSGGPVTGSLLLSTTDGTPQLTLDATDHGGRLLINNDLGFQRVVLGVHQEAGGLYLNNTGSIGVQAVALPKGGVVIVNDSEGGVAASLPEDSEDSHPDWGSLPDSF